MQDDAAGEMKARLRADLRAAMKSGRMGDAKVLRALVAALDNAEAQPAGAEKASVQHRFGDGSAEVERRVLSVDDVRRVLLAEVEERERAAVELDGVGQTERAEGLRAEALLARRYLD